MNNIEILIVEDAQTQAEQIRSLLEENGYKALVASDGEEALKIVYEKAPDLIISDILMPVMDGFELCRIIKENSELAHIPVILLTSLSESDDIIKGLECGADNFVLKPYEDKYLISRIKSLITNIEIRTVEKFQVAIDVYFGGKYYTINSDKRQILDLLMSTFENAVQQNKQLQKSHLEISMLNEQLSENIEELSKINRRLELEIEERKTAEINLAKRSEELKKANQRLTDFAYGVSHDLQEPLRMINSYTQILSKRYKDKLDDSANEFIDFIVDGTVRMKALIDNILEYSKTDSSNKPVEKVDCKLVLDEVFNNLKLSIQDTSSIITNDPLPMINADFTQMIQLFQNLISNAIKFNNKNSPYIHISCVEEENRFIFSVADNGIGISKENSERIFNIFQRLYSRNEYSGTGIGLALCKRIVENYNGEIWVESEENKGSTFLFTIAK